MRPLAVDTTVRARHVSADVRTPPTLAHPQVVSDVPFPLRTKAVGAVAAVSLDAQPTQCTTVDTLTYRQVGEILDNLEVARAEKILRTPLALLWIDHIIVQEGMAAYLQRKAHFLVDHLGQLTDPAEFLMPIESQEFLANSSSCVVDVRGTAPILGRTLSMDNACDASGGESLQLVAQLRQVMLEPV